MRDFDVIIVGCGPAGMFCAYELVTKKPETKVLIVEQGKRLSQRKCPMQNGGKCLKCNVCAITHGSSGAGAFSDGKLLLPHKSDRTVRGNLGRHMTLSESMELYNYTDSVYLQFGATKKIDGEDGLSFINNTLQPYLKYADLNAKCSRIRHLGTDGAREVYCNLEKWLEDHNVKIFFNSEVTDLIVEDNTVCGVKFINSTKTSETIKANNVVLAIGRSGTDWLERICHKYKIEYNFGAADIGIRYELPDAVMQEINANLYEGKFIGYPSPYRDKVRTFCQNPSGVVSSESYRGEITLVNGHSFLKPVSENTNLSLLVSIDGIENPIYMAKTIARNINNLGNGQPLVQRLEDLKNGKSTTYDKIAINSVVPTLMSACPGDISLGIPHRIVIDILGFIDKMNVVAPGFANDDNLIYAPEIKFYNLMLKLKKNAETTVKGLYGIGDGAGPTHGLMPASVNGVFLGRILAQLFN